MAALVWLIVAPLVVGFIVMWWPFGVILALIAVWTTWDYIRKGDVAGHVAEGMSKSGLVGKGAEEMFFDGDPFNDR